MSIGIEQVGSAIFPTSVLTNSECGRRLHRFTFYIMNDKNGRVCY